MTSEQDRELDEYLEARQLGLRSHVQIWPSPRFDDDRGRANRRRIVLFSNITWDSAALGLDGGFDNVQE